MPPFIGPALPELYRLSEREGRRPEGHRGSLVPGWPASAAADVRIVRPDTTTDATRGIRKRDAGSAVERRAPRALVVAHAGGRRSGCEEPSLSSFE